MAVQFVLEEVELKWFLPLVENIENISPEEQGLLVETLGHIDSPEAQVCLEGLREKRVVSPDFQARLTAYMAHLREEPSDRRYTPSRF